MIADATDPIATDAAIAAFGPAMQAALRHDRFVQSGNALPFDVRVHQRYNPSAVNSFNLVPGLVGTILTMTMMGFTALSVTREKERGTIEGLLARPIRPTEIMLGKILPYVKNLIQAGLIILKEPILGLFWCSAPWQPLALALLDMLFITTNLAVGYTI